MLNQIFYDVKCLENKYFDLRVSMDSQDEICISEFTVGKPFPIFLANCYQSFCLVHSVYHSSSCWF